MKEESNSQRIVYSELEEDTDYLCDNFRKFVCEMTPETLSGSPVVGGQVEPFIFRFLLPNCDLLAYREGSADQLHKLFCRRQSKQELRCQVLPELWDVTSVVGTGRRERTSSRWQPAGRFQLH